MPNPITVGYSQLSGKIYAGRSKPLKGNERTRVFTGEKFDVTDEALAMVAHKLKNDRENINWELADGSIMTLSVTVTPAEAQHG
ncbi:hypothetical protein ABA78_07860 [Serratia sp. TEL]|nr:hypothetical protein ABA78_07860 [Serratia sp. TEL]